MVAAQCITASICSPFGKTVERCHQRKENRKARFLGTPVEFRANGARWNAAIIRINGTMCTLTIDGCPSIIMNQPILISVCRVGQSLVVSGKVIQRREEVFPSSQIMPFMRISVDIECTRLSEVVCAFSHGDQNQPTESPIVSFQLIPKQSEHVLLEYNSHHNQELTGSSTRGEEISRSRSRPLSVVPFNTSPILQKEQDKSRSSSDMLASENSTADISSERLELLNRQGHRIVAFHDYPSPLVSSPAPIVVLAPGYGETKREYITLAYYLASNGFHVLRYDHTHHVGESTGHHVQTTLSGMKEDMETVLDFAKRKWTGHSVILVSTSLAGRVALKLVSESHHVDFLVLISGLVNVQSTLAAVHQEDVVGKYEQGIRRGIINVLGFNVDADMWLEDLLKGQFASLQSSIEDAKNIHIPILWFSGEQDTWIDWKDMDAFHTVLNSQRLQSLVIPEGLHRLLENPHKARLVYREIVSQCLRHMTTGRPARPVQDPSRRAIGIQNRVERDAAKANPTLPAAHLQTFWRDYLNDFHFIVQGGDYRQLLDHVYQALDLPDQPIKILDAGCGNGTLAAFLSMWQDWNHQTHRHTHSFIRYVGIDFISEALHLAQQTYGQRTSTDQVSPSTASSRSSASFAQANLNQPLPFQDGQFDRVVSNLVIGYVQDVMKTIKEMFRVLAPGGKLVLTNLKPNSDLTQVYRNFLQCTREPSQIEEGRQLLNNSGKIRQAESEGLFHFFTEKEFEQIMEACGALDIQIHRTFANQAFMAIATKARSMEVSAQIMMESQVQELAA